MARERTLRRPKRPVAYVAILVAAGLISAACIVGAWRIATRSEPAAESEFAQNR